MRGRDRGPATIHEIDDKGWGFRLLAFDSLIIGFWWLLEIEVYLQFLALGFLYLTVDGSAMDNGWHARANHFALAGG